FWDRTTALIAALPPKPARNAEQAAAAARIFEIARESRERFLAVHAGTLYEELTDRRNSYMRLEELVFAAGAAVPGLTPSEEEVAAEARLNQGDKDGVEIDQGIFLAQTLAVEEAGLHLCHAMLLPQPETQEHLARFIADGVLDLGTVRLERRGKAVVLTATNPRYLNAEDSSTIDLMEIAVDVAILDPVSEIAVMRGGKAEHPKYAGRNIFGSGINLTHLYRGKIPFVFFLKRDLGYLHKILRGVARPDSLPDDVRGRGTEKPWVAAVETFAIGGHCQILLVADYVLAADDAYMTLPARQEGIIPGFANLRLPRHTGDRIAREAIQYDLKLVCDSQMGRLICDEIASADAMDEAIDKVVTGLTDAGVVSAIGNRRAFRVGEEPLDLFRRYASVYAREQAYCHFSRALIANLERNWDAKNRTA
ncbi:MAG: enoyl-CoA hydratase/isomerase family protein, partial [Bauldia sp.]|nr:enoyl-CoA hydratase/isomerase family protein [Bauldia sp.]